MKFQRLISSAMNINIPSWLVLSLLVLYPLSTNNSRKRVLISNLGYLQVHYLVTAKY